MTSPRRSTSPRSGTFKNRALIKFQEGFLELTLLRSDPLPSAPLCRDIVPQPEDPFFCRRRACPYSMDKLPTEVAIEIASRIAKAATDPMEDLGSLWATCSQMRRVRDDAIVGWSIPLR